LDSPFEGTIRFGFQQLAEIVELLSSSPTATWPAQWGAARIA